MIMFVTVRMWIFKGPAIVMCGLTGCRCVPGEVLYWYTAAGFW